MEEQIKLAKLNAEYKKKNNDIKARKQMVENLKHTRLQHAARLAKEAAEAEEGGEQ